MAQPELHSSPVEFDYPFWSRGVPAALATSVVLGIVTWSMFLVVAEVLP